MKRRVYMTDVKHTVALFLIQAVSKVPRVKTCSTQLTT